MRTLLDIVENLGDFDEEDIIFARAEWTPDSDAELFRLTEDDKMPDEPKKLGLKYFLEIEIARQILESFADKPSTPSIVKCERLIEYAIHDA